MDSLITIEEALDISEKELRNIHKEYLNPGLVATMGLVKFDRLYTEAKAVLLGIIRGRNT